MPAAEAILGNALDSFGGVSPCDRPALHILVHDSVRGGEALAGRSAIPIGADAKVSGHHEVKV
jgi:hypothetical protein